MAQRKKKSVSRKKKTTASKSKSMALPWQQKLAEHAKAGKAPKERPANGASYISLKGGKFTLNDERIGLNGKGLELDCIVVGWNFEKAYYDAPFVEGEKGSPACFAIGLDEDELVPNETSPNKQCDNCADCWANEWGSANVGEGKLCADRRRLALAFADKDGKFDIKMLNIPPTSLKNWKTFVNEVDTMGLHTMQCAINISFDEEYTGSSSVPPLVFTFINEITSEKQLQFLANTLDTVDKMLEKPYDVSNYGGSNKTSKKKGKKKAAKKKSAKKKSSRRSKFS